MPNPRKLALAAASVAFALLVGESLLQVGYRVRNGAWLPVEARGFQVGYTARVADRRQFSLRPDHVEAEVNAFGFRGAPIAIGTDIPVVCVLGDSVPFGLYASAEESYPNQLEHLLGRHGLRQRVLNAGVPAYNIRQSFDRFRIDVRPRYRPAIVVLQAANDISLLTQYREKWTPDVTWASVRFADTWNGSWWRASALYHYLSRVGHVDEAHKPYPADAMLASIDGTIAEQAPYFAAQGAPLVLMPIDPFYYSDDTDGRNERLRQWPRWKGHAQVWRSTVDGVNRVLAEAARKYPGVRFFDVRKEMDTQDRDRMFLDYIHYSAEGARFVAARLYRYLVEQRLIRAAGADPDSLLMELGLDDRYRAGNAAAAVAEFERVLQDNPAHYGATFQLAAALDAAGRGSEARPVWEKVLARARAVGDSATATTAEARLRARDVDSEDDEALMTRGLELLYERRDPAAAAALFDKVLARTPKHYGATYQLAVALDRQGRREQARVTWQKMLAMAEAVGDRAVIATARAHLEPPSR